ncbi:MAG: FliA/WhiG family RNA polymerase sigma factor [Nitrospinota bacterium]
MAAKGKEKFDPSDKEAIVLKYTPLKFIAHRIAMRLPPHIEVEELINSGVLGLMDAIDKFDPTRDVQFKTYAEFRIRGAILDELRAMDWVPRSVRQRSNLLEDTYARLEQELGRAATEEEVARELGVSLEEFQDMLAQAGGISLVSFEDFRAGEEEEARSLLETLAGLEEEDPHYRITFEELKRLLGQAIDALPEREHLVVSLYYYDELTMKEIGRTLDITESRVSQIHTQAILRLRGKLRRMAER